MVAQTSGSAAEEQGGNRLADYEKAWMATDIQRVLGTTIMDSDEIEISEDSDHEYVQMYQFFRGIKEDLVNEGQIDPSYPPRKYQEHFEVPSESIWTEFSFDDTPEALGGGTFDVTGLWEVPQDVAMEELGVDYDEEENMPIFLPKVGGDEFDPVGLMDGHTVELTKPEAEDEAESEAESDLPPWERGTGETAEADETDEAPPWEQEGADEGDTTEADEESADDDVSADSEGTDETPEPEQTAEADSGEKITELENAVDFENVELTVPISKIELGALDRQELSALFKAQDPARKLSDIVELIGEVDDRGYSTSSVSNALNKHFDSDTLKEKSREARNQETEEAVETGEEAVEEAVEEESESVEESEPAEEVTDDIAEQAREQSTESTETPEDHAESGRGATVSERMAALGDAMEIDDDQVVSAMTGAFARLAIEERPEAIFALRQGLNGEFDSE